MQIGGMFKLLTTLTYPACPPPAQRSPTGTPASILILFTISTRLFSAFLLVLTDIFLNGGRDGSGELTKVGRGSQAEWNLLIGSPPTTTLRKHKVPLFLGSSPSSLSCAYFELVVLDITFMGNPFDPDYSGEIEDPL